MIHRFHFHKQINRQTHSIDLIPAFTFWRRFFGFMGRKDPKEGMIFNRTNQIHMFFMRFPIDVYFLNRSGKVIDIQRNIKPWRISRKVKDAYFIIETPLDFGLNLEIGDRVEVKSG